MRLRNIAKKRNDMSFVWKGSLVASFFFIASTQLQFNVYDQIKPVTVSEPKDGEDTHVPNVEPRVTYQHPSFNEFPLLDNCTPDQLSAIERMLGFDPPKVKRQTACPTSPWLPSHYKEYFYRARRNESGSDLSNN